jgi:hypothetical protein
MTRIKHTKRKGSLFLTVERRRFKISYKDIRLFRETVIGALGYGGFGWTNFPGLSMRVSEKGIVSTIEIRTPHKVYKGTMPSVILSGL